MENKVLTQEELQSLKKLQETRNQLVSDFGFTEIQIQELELQKDTLVKSLEELKQEEYRLGNEIQNKYGRVQVNLDSGEITPLD
jgi:mRNA-degrading endonuclease RelE of RelBE toxin-antitoxin system